MSRVLHRLIQYMLAGYFVLTLFNGISLPSNYIYLFSTFFIFSLAIFSSSLILNFLTIRENFITSLLMSSLLIIGVFFAMEAFMPGFTLEVYTFEGIETGNFVIHSFEVSKVINIVAGSMTYSFVTSILNVLDKNS